jgi:hypothetical protein
LSVGSIASNNQTTMGPWSAPRRFVLDCAYTLTWVLHTLKIPLFMVARPCASGIVRFESDKAKSDIWNRQD